MSRLATIAGALSAIVTLGDYLFANSFLSHWLQRQFKHGADGWQISPTFNLLCIAMLVGLVWLATEPSSADPEARKRLFRLRANVVIGGLVVWFFLGPSIAETDVADPTRPNIEASAAAPAITSQPLGRGPGTASYDAAPYDEARSEGRTDQFTWKRPADSPPPRGWRPGDGLRAMARIFEDAAGSPSPER